MAGLLDLDCRLRFFSRRVGARVGYLGFLELLQAAMEAALEAKRKEAEADAEVAAANEAAKFAAAALAPPEAPPDWLARNTAAPPLDLTFSKLRLCADIASAEERKDDTRANSRASSRASSRPLSRMGGVRNSRYEYDINAVTSARLNNNKLTCLDGLADALVPRLQPFQIAQQLLWLDLSFNLWVITHWTSRLLRPAHNRSLRMCCKLMAAVIIAQPYRRRACPARLPVSQGVVSPLEPYQKRCRLGAPPSSVRVGKSVYP